ncbi:MAG: hypothetical protein PSX71_12195 [bacterium]|nr:hypothetical protein [bacterium]
MKTPIIMTTAGFVLALLGGCVGSDTPPPDTPPPVAEGLWQGTLNGSVPASARTFSALVLDDGSLWMLYSTAGNSTVATGASNLGGAMQGAGTSDAGIYSILNTSSSRIFPLDGLSSPVQLSLAATYTALSRFDGTINPGAVPFASLYDTDYNYAPPPLATLAGGPYTSTASATLAGKETATFSMDGSGNLVGVTNSSACTINGTFIPRARGAYNVSLTLGANCGVGLGNTTIAGRATYDTVSKQLNVLAVNSAKTAVFVLIGSKP